MEQEPIMTMQDYLPLAGVIIGGFLAILGGLASNIAIEWYRDKTESKRLALAFKGELAALSNIVRKRGYIEIINSMISTMERTGKPEIFYVRVRREYFNVFNTNVGRIGTLKNPLPELVAKFYVQANSVLEDIQSSQ